jgi:Putative beta-barrel porin-2, OmpL-like. bbp2
MNKLVRPTALAASIAIITPVAFADGFQLSEKLGVTGFIDMSMLYTDPDGGPSSSSSSLDQFEIDFLYQFDDKLSAQVDLEYDDDGAGQVADIEQAFFTYALCDQLSFTAGRFLSYSGWETQEPTGLFQYSGTGYAKYFYGAYQQGVSTKYDGGNYQIALSLVNDLGDLMGSGTELDSVGAELMLALMPVEGLTAKAFYMTEKDTDLINVWASYAIADFIFAVEVNSSENAGAAVALPGAGADAEATGFLVMANYTYEQFGLTLRYHESEVENAAGTTVEELNAITLSPSYKVSDNLLIVTELRMDDDDLTGASMDTIAVEALVTF